MTADWVIWQLADSAFPSGGFAHSGGLEAMWRWGELADAAGLVDYVKTNLAQVAQSSLPFVVAARNRERLEELDALCDDFLTNHVANRASRSLGQAFLVAAEAAFGRRIFTAWRAAVANGRLAGHWAPLFGGVTSELDIDVGQSVRLFLHIQLRGLISSAVRLNIVGPLQGQTIQTRLGPFAEQLALRCSQIPVEDVAQTAPFVEVLQQTHDRLYSRLFQS